MDCDDVMLVLADGRTLTGVESVALVAHLATCPGCTELAHAETDDREQRWIARLPEDAFDDPDLLVLPMVDPIVFTADREIAAGGMGKITRARDRRLGREVAIKEMLAPELRARFEREAMITARLQHPAIVPIYEAGTWPNGNAFYTMRLVTGGTLAHAIEGAKTLVARLALLPHVIAVTEALAYAHSRKIIHRDVKPQNVLVGEFGETVVIDWGLAKELGQLDEAPALAHAAPELTQAGSVIGTPCFMAPEQARGDAIDARADVFALGAILYNVLAGQPPYWDQPHDTAEQLIEAVLLRAPTAIASHAPDAPADLRAIAERAMARNPQDRFASAKEMAEELRRFQAGQLLLSREYSVRDHLVRWVARHRGAVGVGVLAAIALAVVAIVAVRNVARSRDAERSARLISESASREIGRSVAALLEEQGRNLFVSGQREQALADLTEAYSRGRDTPSLRYLLSATTRDVDLLTATIEAPGDIDLGAPAYAHVVFVADHALLAVALGNDGVRLDMIRAGAIVHSVWIAGSFLLAEPSPDGATLITIGGDHATAWDAASGTVRWAVASDAGAVVWGGPSSVALLSHGEGGAAYDVATGAVLVSVPATAKVAAIAFDLDAGIILVATLKGGCDFYVRKVRAGWDHIHLDSGYELEQAAFMGKGADAKLVLTTKKGEVLLWSVDQLFHAIGGHPGAVVALAAAPLRRFATAGSNGGVKLWDKNGALVAELATKHAIDELVFSHNPTMLAATGRAPALEVWNFVLGPIGRLQPPDHEFSQVSGVAFDLDDSQLATIDDLGKHVHVWKTPRTSLVANRAGSALAVGDRIAVAGFASELRVIELATGKVIRSIAMPAPMRHRAAFQGRDHSFLQLSADGARAMVIGKASATIYDLTTGRVVRELPWSTDNDDEDSEYELAPDGARVIEYGAKFLRAFDLATGKALFAKPMPAYFGERGAVSPDGTRVILATQPPLAFALPSGAALAMPNVAFDVVKGKADVDASPNDVAFSPDGSHFVMLGLSAPVLVETATGKTERALHYLPIDSAVQTARFDASGWRLVTEAENRAVVWDTATGRVVFTVDDVAGHAVAIARDGSRIATGSREGTIRIWDATGRLLDELRGHHEAIEEMGFSADGSRLVAQGADKETTIWDVHLDQRTPAQIKAIAAAATGYTVTEGSLTLRKGP